MEQKEKKEAVMGFDFGTSCSKVIIYISGERYAIDFSSITQRKDYPYFLPTRLCLTESQNFSLTEKGECNFPDIKLKLINNPHLAIRTSQGSITAIELVIAYLALAFQQVRIIFTKQYPHYEKYDLKWSINLGMPASSYDNKELYHALFIALVAAWEVSFEEYIKLLSIKKSYDGVKKRIDFKKIKNEKGFYDETTDTSFSIFPEVIAQIVGYAKSPLRTEGLHLLIDIGASTLDMGTFNVFSEDGEDKFPIFVSEIQILGTLILHKHRVDKFKEKQGININFEMSNDFSPIPTKYETHDLTIYDEDFLKKCTAFIQKGIRETKKYRCPTGSEWKKGIRVFMCGGGSQLTEYRSIIKNINKWFYEYTSEGTQFNIVDLPIPENIKVLKHEFHRLSVAYGLSFSSFDIGEVKLPSEIPDFTKKESTNSKSFYRDRYIDKDQT